MGFDWSAYISTILYLLLFTSVVYLGFRLFTLETRMAMAKDQLPIQAIYSSQSNSVSPNLVRRYLRRRIFASPDDNEGDHVIAMNSQ